MAKTAKTKDEANGLAPLIGGKKTFQLSDGRTVVMREGSGADAEEAQAVFGNDKKKYMSALMVQCITVDGKKLVMEDLPIMKLKDFLKIQTEFSILNF